MSDTSAGGLVALCAAFTGLAVVSVGLRFYVRRVQDAPLKTDDWLMVLAVITYIGASICCWYGVAIKEEGYPEVVSEATVNPETRDLLEVCLDIFTILCLGCTKASAVFFYKRVFCTSGYKVFKYILYATLAVIAIWVIVMEFLTGFQCHGHFDALWDGSYNKYCTISEGFLLALSISDVVLDVWVLSLPVPMVLRLHARLVRKLSVMGVFLIGLAGLGAGIGRLVIIVQVNQLGPIGLEHIDAELVETKIAFFYMLETGTSLLAINMISLWPFFFKIAPEAILRGMRSMSSLRSRYTGRSSDSGNGHSSESVSDRNNSVLKSNFPNLSTVYNAQVTHESHELHIMSNLNEHPAPAMPENGIMVQGSVRVESDGSS